MSSLKKIAIEEAERLTGGDENKQPTLAMARDPIESIDLEWQNLTIKAEVTKKQTVDGKKVTVKEDKMIIDNISGAVKHGRFTAILGPSGSGKTTLLNFLSGRITGKTLKIKGKLRVNSENVNDIEKISNLVAYVMQDDILFATVSPREAFTFAANLRLKGTETERRQRVEDLIKDLGLSKCAETMIGNNLIRGISGGERKRTSIGVELITNPSMMFLDEPTTGLDSSTALKVLELLRSLSASGRNIVSTIHQPSSEIYECFDDLILLVRGKMIYQGDAHHAVNHFANIGFPCPKYSNPADFFTKIMNETGSMMEELEKKDPENAIKALEMKMEELEGRFIEKVIFMKEKYDDSGLAEKSMTGCRIEPVNNEEVFNVTWLRQFWLLVQRNLTNEFRNPFALKLKLFQALFFGLICYAVFKNLGEGFSAIQNRQGVLFFLGSSACFGSIQGSLSVFSAERPIFVRERLSRSYRVSSYFWAKVFTEAPFLVIYPVVLISVVYFSIGLNTSSKMKFVYLCIIHVLTYFAGSGYGQVLSSFIPNLQVATALTPVLIIPFMIFAGYFVNSKSIPWIFVPFEYLSIWKYNFEAACINEFTNLNVQFPPGIDPLKALGFNADQFVIPFIILGGIAIGMRLVAYIGLNLMSTPRRPKAIEFD